MNNGAGNRLSNETSPYLLQHAADPVDWYPWGAQALEKARAEKKLIFLSIGYSACHWCHRMAQESFRDADIAALLNQMFVNIKVDREERPDLDRIYQNAHQLLNGRAGGWPLNVILTPDDQTPFFAATFIPKESRDGLPGLADLMRGLQGYFLKNEGDVRKQNDDLLAALRAGPSRHGRSGYSLQVSLLGEAVERLSAAFDADHGGFGKAPKFVQPGALERLLRHWHHSSVSGQADTKAGQIAKFSLQKIAYSGLWDHLGGGFFRYAVDAKWMIPHFEKMLYDNALLVALYAQAWQVSGVPAFRQVVENTVAWAVREMRDAEGPFYASLDADSAGGEGRFYTWTPEEAKAVLEPSEYEILAACLGLDRHANFAGRWHLHGARPLEAAAKKAGIPPAQAAEAIAGAREKLRMARAQRPAPGRDEKILTAWNGLMIKGLAIAARLLERQDYLVLAEQALAFIQTKLFADGVLWAVYKDGKARFPGYLDDYAFVLEGVLELLQCRWRSSDFDFAMRLGETLLDRFQDPRRQGGFFFTNDAHEPLIQRPKPIFDEGTPSGNGVTAYNLIRIGNLSNSIRHLVAAERALKNSWASIERNPVGCSALLLALEEYYYPSQQIVIRGSAPELDTWRRRCTGEFAPRRYTLAIPDDAKGLPGFLARCQARDRPVAYICERGKCSAPITDLQQLEAALAAGGG